MWAKPALPSHELLGQSSTAQLRPAHGLFRFCLQVRPSSLATTPIRPSCHLSGCQLIIMILMIFQLDSALSPDQGHGRFPTGLYRKGPPPLGEGREEGACRSAWRSSTFHIHWAHTAHSGPQVPWTAPPPPLQGQAHETPSPTTRGLHL